MWTFLVLLSLGLSLPVWAGGPFLVNSSGTPFSWESPITIHPETGTCAAFSNSKMLTRLETNLANWSDITNITLGFDIEAGTLDEDVDGSNYGTYYVASSADPGATDKINPIMFDDDGGIITALVGEGMDLVVLGFAGPDIFDDDHTILGGQALFNCRCLAGNPEGACTSGATVVLFTTNDLDFTMVHELGHMIGLDHTQVNQALMDEELCDPLVNGECDDLPTMFPISVDAADQISPSRDDEVAILTLYGLEDMESVTCTVTGTVVDADENPLRCADIQARSTDIADTIAVVSGVFAATEDTDGDGYTTTAGECLSGCGGVTLRGLAPGTTYAISVVPIDEAWQGGSGINPCGNNQLETVVEQEIAAVSALCTEGATISLGTVITKSTGGTTEGSESSSGSSTSSSTKAIGPVCNFNLMGATTPGPFLDFLAWQWGLLLSLRFWLGFLSKKLS